MYNQLPAAAKLNHVPGFDPARYLRKKYSKSYECEVVDLDLEYKKLWFRLVYPNGRLETTAVKITDQIAIFNTKVFFHLKDTEPVACFTSQEYKDNNQKSLYILNAQRESQSQALCDAGFGVQFHPAEMPITDIRNTDTNCNHTTQQDDNSSEIIPPINEQPQSNINDQKLFVEFSIKTQPTDEPKVIQYESQLISENKIAAFPAADLQERSSDKSIAKTSNSNNQNLSSLLQAESISSADNIPVDTTTAALLSNNTEIQEGIVKESSEAHILITPDMSIEDICKTMTMEQALDVVVDIGTCNGWTLAEVAEKRAASLKWYLNGYPGENKLLKAGAMKILEEMFQQKVG